MAFKALRLLLITAALTALHAPALLAQPQGADPSAILQAMTPDFCAHAELDTTTLCEKGWREFQQEKFSKAAQSWEEAADTLNQRAESGSPQALSERAFQAQIDMLIRSAHAWEEAEDFSRAGMGYYKSAKLNDRLSDYLNFKAAQSLVRAHHPPPDILKKLQGSGAFDRGFDGSQLLHAQTQALLGDGLPDEETLERALQSSSRAETCEWMSERFQLYEHLKVFPDAWELLYGYCLPDELFKGFDSYPMLPFPQMRLLRAERWFGAVRFQNAQKEFAQFEMEKLDPIDRCRAEFILGRTLFRLKKRSDALEKYQKVAQECTDPKNEDERVRALYAAGDTLYWRSRFAESKAHFETLLKDYPQRSHADDAILYLARIARKTSQPDQEKALVLRALKDYPDGDMLHEIVWEYTEAAVRAGRHEDFLKTLAALDMPEQDLEYFSQGRLEYFAGRAHLKLGQKEKAFSAWQKNWQKYPFSFYGYLSRERLIEADQIPESLDQGAKMRAVDWFLDPAWRRSAGAELTRLGLYKMAAAAEKARLLKTDASDADRWRLAALEHLAENYPTSHNIARRQIPGRPWAAPADGSLVRWQIGWPNPFESDIQRAVVAERRQAPPGVLIEPALPASIMREESSFIEDIESYAGALGLMQLMPATAAEHDSDIPGGTNHDNLKTSLINIRVGVDHLFSLARRFDNHPVLIAAAYNAGGGAVNGWLRRFSRDEIGLWVEDIPYDQTRNYTKRVIGSYAAYQWLSGVYDLDPTVVKNP